MTQNFLLRLVARSPEAISSINPPPKDAVPGEVAQSELDGRLHYLRDFHLQPATDIDALRSAMLSHSASLSAYAIMPQARLQMRLAVFDTDSTFIDQEVIDEIADFAGRKKEVAAITERAMRGELDFNAALAERVQLLAGLDTEVMAKVRDTRLSLTNGAPELVRALQAQQIKTYLVSGGFSFFTGHFARLLGMTGEFANDLESESGKLTGRTRGQIVNRQRKADLLRSVAVEHGIALNATVAVGDGANDVDMCRASGMGIAFCAKPALQNETYAAVFERDLRLILPLLSN